MLELDRSTVNDVHRNIEAQIPRLRRYARALTRDAAAADDLVQDCLARGLAKLHLWQEGTDLRAWLFTIMRNQYVNQIRRSAREGAAVGLSECEPLLTRAPDQSKRLELRDLERGLASLPEQQRSVILLVGLEGMRYEEVAEVMGVPVGTVRSRLSRGRDALRRLMESAPQRPLDAAVAGRTATLPMVRHPHHEDGFSPVRASMPAPAAAPAIARHPGGGTGTIAAMAKHRRARPGLRPAQARVSSRGQAVRAAAEPLARARR